MFNPIIVLVLILVNLIGGTAGAYKKQTETKLPYLEGEEIVYDVKLNGMKIGNSSLKFVGEQKLGGKHTMLYEFTTDIMNFYDEELIYTDINSIYPLKVVRTLTMWGKPKKIYEVYNQADNSVKITEVESESKDKIIQHDTKISNVILIIYYLRRLKEVKTGDVFSFQLPTRAIDLKVTRKEEVSIKEKKFDTYLIASSSPKIKIWLQISDKKFPVKIQGMIPSILPFSHFNLVMSDNQN